ncbi:MAG: diguanylate cyclase [Planctomycetota bacterium]|nr:MAG: diguanylate cyclase [Planctomycetota bacterium]
MSHSPPQRILVIDDQAAIHEDYRKILGGSPAVSAAAVDRAAAELFDETSEPQFHDEGYEIDSALQGQEGVALVEKALAERRPYAMAFVDIRMPPGWDGIETVRRIWSVDPEILIVICSAYCDYSWQEMVSALGRNDRYLILRKPFDNIEVRQCAMALTERWRASRTDVLTGLLNRRAFGNYFNTEWWHAQQRDLPLAFAMFDLDRFKQINDTMGHPVGDAVLRHVSQILVAKCHASFSVCRYGGEEFCVLLPQTTEREASNWAEHVRQTVESTPALLDSTPVYVTTSIGVGQRLHDDTSGEQLIERADQALISAKATGRNRVVRHSMGSRARSETDNYGGVVDGWSNVALGDVLSTPVLALKSTATIGQVIQLFGTCPIESIPVVNADGRLAGVVAAADIFQLLPRIDAWTKTVTSVMRQAHAFEREGTSVRSIVRWLEESGLSCAHVTHGGAPVGVVRRHKLLGYAHGGSNPTKEKDWRTAACLSGEVDRSLLWSNAQRLAESVATIVAAGTREGADTRCLLDLFSLNMLLEEPQGGVPPAMPIVDLGPSGGLGTPSAPPTPSS